MELITRLRDWWQLQTNQVNFRAGLRRSRRRLVEIRRQLRPGQKLVVIALTEHLGDIVACEPVARYVRAQHPDDFILWICAEPYRDLMAAHPALNEVLPVTCLTEFSRLTADHAFDRVYDLHVKGRHCSWLWTEPKKIHGSSEVTMDNYFSHGSLLEAFSKAAGIPPLHEGPRMHLPADAAERVKPLGLAKPFLVIHAASNSDKKDWPAEKWRALTPRLAGELDMTLVEVGLRPRVAGPGVPVVDLCGKLSIVQLVEVIREAEGFMGIDSGPAHLANAFARPSVILLGRFARFERYMPYTGYLREHAGVMLLYSTGPAAEITVEEVLQRARGVMRALGR